jgi:alcohol dehydrogenase YqhD (iron-dependent ADH family)
LFCVGISFKRLSSIFNSFLPCSKVTPNTSLCSIGAGRYAGCTGKDDKEVFENFLAKLEVLKEQIGIKKSIKEYGIDEKYFLDTLDDMVEQAFNDQCTGANPRYPLMKEIKELYLKCYYGKKFPKENKREGHSKRQK